MALLSRIASVVNSYRAAKASVGILSAAGAVAPLAAAAQQVAADTKGQQVASLEAVCPNIRIVFSYAKFQGTYKGEVDAWLKGGCKGATPLPRDPHNVKWFNTVAGILQDGGGISLNP